MLSAELLNKSVVSAAAANCALCADKVGNELKDSLCVVVKTTNDCRIYRIFNTCGIKVFLNACKVLFTLVAKIIVILGAPPAIFEHTGLLQSSILIGFFSSLELQVSQSSSLYP